MNILDVQDNLKNFSEKQLINEMQMPSGNAPQFLVLSEITRRKRMRDQLNMQKAANEPTVAQEAVASAGVPAQGIMGMSEAMAPKAAMAQGGIGSVMSQPMKPQMPQSMPMPDQGVMAMSSGGSTKTKIEERRMKNGKIGLFKGNTFLGTKQESGGLGSLAEKIGFGGKSNVLDSIKGALGFADGGPLSIRTRSGDMTDQQYEAFMARQRATEGMGVEDSMSAAMSGLDSSIAARKRFEEMNKILASGGHNDYSDQKKIDFVSEYKKLKQDNRFASGGVVKAQNGLPLGLRQRNPGNIRPGAGFIGESGDGSGYATFGSDDEGLRAIQRLLMTYGDKYDIKTLRQLANRYAPPSDNNPTENYIDFLSDKTGIGPDDEINLAESGSSIIPAIVGFEQGQQPYSQAQIDRAIRAAGTDDPAKVAKILGQPLDDVLSNRGVSASDLFQSGAEPNFMSAMAATPVNQTPMPDIPQDIIRDQTGRAIGDASYGPRIRAAMETGNEDIANNLVAQGLNEANFFEQMYRNRDPDDLGNLGQDAVTSGVAGITTPVGPGTIDPGQMLQVLPLDPTQKTISVDSTQSDIDKADAVPASTPQTAPVQPPAPVAPKVESEASSLEAELLKLQEDMSKSREQDKWLSLAQAGLALMSSKEPTLMGALGEAGLSGLGAMKEAESRYQEGVIDLINARAKLNKTKKPAIAQKDILDAQIEIMKDPLATPEDRARAKSIADSIVGGAGFGLVKIPQQAAS